MPDELSFRSPAWLCLFCDRAANEIIGETECWYIRLDGFPANPGHVEIVPKRHVDRFFDLDGHESAELFSALAHARDLVAARWGEPDAWTIGVNDGRAAGRSIDHLHVHLIPRHHGDVPDPRGGIRQCAPNFTPDAWTTHA
jgi:diadenosine tetraphosphate (Ap4A) HIT family hydrolase